jgi:hypothetical protein
MCGATSGGRIRIGGRRGYAIHVDQRRSGRIRCASRYWGCGTGKRRQDIPSRWSGEHDLPACRSQGGGHGNRRGSITFGWCSCCGRRERAEAEDRIRQDDSGDLSIEARARCAQHQVLPSATACWAQFSANVHRGLRGDDNPATLNTTAIPELGHRSERSARGPCCTEGGNISGSRFSKKSMLATRRIATRQ